MRIRRGPSAGRGPVGLGRAPDQSTARTARAARFSRGPRSPRVLASPDDSLGLAAPLLRRPAIHPPRGAVRVEQLSISTLRSNRLRRVSSRSCVSWANVRRCSAAVRLFATFRALASNGAIVGSQSAMPTHSPAARPRHAHRVAAAPRRCPPRRRRRPRQATVRAAPPPPQGTGTPRQRPDRPTPVARVRAALPFKSRDSERRRSAVSRSQSGQCDSRAMSSALDAAV